MKSLAFCIAVFCSLHSFGQPLSVSDSLRDIPLYNMVAIFKKIDSQKLSIAEKNELQFQEIKSFIKSNPKSPFSSQFILWGKYFDTQKIDTLFSLLDTSLQASWIKESIVYQKIRSKIIPGIFFPDLVLTDTLNKQLHISDLKGNIVFIDIWASWCGPCREEMPALIKLYEKYKDKGFIVIAISLDDDKEKWLKAIAKDAQPWQQFCELKIWRNNTMFRNWGITGIPYNFLIDKEGKLIDKGINIYSLEEKIKELL